MGVAETYSRGRRTVVEQPLAVVVALVGVGLLVDLIVGLATGDVLVSSVATYLWSGTVLGLALGLAGVGLSMTYSILNFANFAHGDYLSGGAFAGWATTYVIAGLGTYKVGDLMLIGMGTDVNASAVGVNIAATPLAIFLGLVVAMVATIAISLGVDRLVYRPMRDSEGIALLIASIGVALALRYLLAFVFGPTTPGVTASNEVAIPALTIAELGITINAHELALAVAAIGLMAGVHVLLQRTKLGTAMRAMADNESLALVTGIPTERVVRDTWVIGGALTGAAGYLLVLERGTITFDFGWLLLLLIFAAVILGGIGSVYGAMAGGLTVGIASRLALVWIPSDFATPAAFLVMIVVLLVKPEGLFGGVTTA